MRRFLIGAAWLLIAVLSVRAQSSDELSGRFSIRSNGEQVVFSRGNLCLAIENSSWYFATNQYDIIGEANIFGGALSTPIDLFGYSGSTYYNWGVSPVNANSLFSGDFIDWGENSIGQSPAGYWRTLTTYEWDYLLNQRDNAAQLRGVATVSGQKGLVLLPDVAADAVQDTYTATEWTLMEQQGAVFLPFGGRRIRANRVDSIGTRGYYWTATPFAGDYVGLVNLGQSSISMDQSDRFYGHSVRLIHSIGIQRDSVYSVAIGQDCSFTNPVNTKADACTVTIGVDGCPAQYSNTFAYRDVVNLTAVAADCGEFVAWSDGETANPRSIQLTGSLSLRAIFKIKQFEAQFRNTDGSLVATDSVLCGETPAAPATNPTREATAQYTYSFVGWTPELAAPLTADQTYTATYDSVLNQYSVNFVDYDGTPIAFGMLNYGETPIYEGSTPTRPATLQYSYQFKGWTPALAPVTGNQVYTADYDSLSLAVQVQFKDYDGSLLDSMTIYSGQTPAYTGTEPTRAATAQYTYTFVGWTPELAAPLTADQTYTATYDSVLNQYSVNFVDYDGTPIAFGMLNYGETPIYEGSTPTRPATLQYSYQFKGWTPALSPVTGNQVYTADYDSISLAVQVQFVDYDGTPISAMTIYSGQTPAYEGTEPTRAATAQYTYTFAGWTPEFAALTADQIYTATYDSVVNRYRVDYVDYDGTPLAFDSLYYGETPAYTGENPTRAATAVFEYSFMGWTPAYTAVTADQVYTAQYDSISLLYAIRFVDYNDSLLYDTYLGYGETPSAPAITPTRQATAEYTYAFAGWTPAFYAVTENQTYTAQYDSVVNRYRVDYVDYDGTPLAFDSLDYGMTPAFTGTEPTRQATAEYTYTFAGWTPAYAAVTGNQIYTAVYDSVVNRYRIAFVDYDGTPLAADSFAYGMRPSYSAPTLPEREATAEFTYSFAGWTPAFAPVTGDQTYTAVYDSVVNRYRVDYVDYDGTPLAFDSLDYGMMPAFTGTEPARQATAEYTYSFAGWTPAYATVAADQIYTAVYDSVVNRYEIVFQDYDEAELQTDTIDYGMMPSYRGLTPTRAATAEYTYTFAGWTPELTTVSDNAVYTAMYDSVVNRYAVSYYDYNGAWIQTDTLEYGSMPEYQGIEPVRTATAEYTYSFTGWTPAFATVIADQAYTAVYDSVTNRYQIDFMDYDGAPLQTDSLDYGMTPAFTGTEPARMATDEYTYAFTGWTPAIASVTGNAVYTATYDSIINRYKIDFVNYDGTPLYSDSVAYNQLPTYGAGTQPTREANEQYSYIFTGWQPALTAVTGDALYTAAYDSTVNRYRVAYLDYNGSLIKADSLYYGDSPAYAGNTPSRSATAQYTYTFAGWTPAYEIVESDQSYTAQYDSVVNSYEVRFVNYDNTLLQRDTLAYGLMPAYNGTTPTRPANESYSYTFRRWTPTIVSVTGDAVYTAVYDSTAMLYTVRFLNYDSTVLYTSQLTYGTLPVYRGNTPTRPATDEFSYVFSGWFPTVTEVTGDADYLATYAGVRVEYKVEFRDYNGTLLLTDSVAYGTTPVYTGVIPTRAANVQYTYTFTGWTPELVAITGDAVYTAVYDSVVNRYTVTFLNYDLTVLQTSDVAYGSMPQYTAAEPQKDATQAYSYIFTGWTPEVVVVTEPATYTAVFDSVVNKYTITLEGDNAIFIGAGTYEYGTHITVEALPADGYHFVEWSDGDWHNPREVDVIADLTLRATIEIDCIGLNSVPVARIYDWLLLLNVSGLEEMGYTVTDDDVTWFRAIGDIDDPEHRDDDELVGRGFYLKVGEAYVGNGRFYAVVDVSENISTKDNLCTGYIRSDAVSVGLTGLDDVTGENWTPYLYPAAVRPDQTVTVQGLMPNSETRIRVYDLAGHVIEEAVAERGEREYRLTAPAVSGTYLVELRTENQQIVLRYIVLHP